MMNMSVFIITLLFLFTYLYVCVCVCRSCIPTFLECHSVLVPGSGQRQNSSAVITGKELSVTCTVYDNYYCVDSLTLSTLPIRLPSKIVLTHFPLPSMKRIQTSILVSHTRLDFLCGLKCLHVHVYTCMHILFHTFPYRCHKNLGTP